MPNNKISIDVEVLDADFCSKCKLLDVDHFVTDLYSGQDVVGTLSKAYCRSVHKCKYLRDLFGSASDTPPKIENESS